MNVPACQQQLNVAYCRVYAVTNVSHLLSWVNIKAKRICEDEIRPHLLTCLKSGRFNEFPSSKPDKKIVHCEEKNRLNLMYFECILDMVSQQK